MDGWILTLIILGTIALFLLIIALLYIISAQRRRSIVYRKIDYLVEDVTYKAEVLNSTVETIAKVSNYVDVFDVFARKNIKSLAKVVSNNKDDIYKVLNRIRKMAVGKDKDKDNAKGGKK